MDLLGFSCLLYRKIHGCCFLKMFSVAFLRCGSMVLRTLGVAVEGVGLDVPGF